ncbi:DUF3859 domain-containing protein [Microbulbifer sp. SAOS-129_SWC]|uniref:prolyl oligopeptidase family serine peptidase n=1 Tax=Microbulbifer sp. SAOS-129_SWC TaxID=3145235 RepID=UPI003216FFFF
MKVRYFWLVLFILPSINHAKTLDPDKLFSDPNILDLKLSPDAKYVASYIDADKNFIALTDYVAGRNYRLVTFPDKYRVLEFNWVDSDTIYVDYMELSSNISLHAFISFSFFGDTPKIKTYYSDAKGYVVGFLPDEDDQVLFAKSGSSHGDQKVYKVSVSELSSGDISGAKNFRKPMENTFFYGWDSASQSLLSVALDNKKIGIWQLRKDAKEWRKLYEFEDTDEQFLPVSFRGDSELTVLTNKTTDLVSLATFNINTQKIDRVIYSDDRYDLTNASFDRDGSLVSVSYFDHGRMSKHFFADRKKKEFKLLEKAFPGKQISIVSTASKSNKKIIRVYSSDDPGSYYVFDDKKLSANFLSKSYFELSEKDLNTSRELSTQLGDGTEIESILTVPKGFNNHVLLVVPHGGPVGVRDVSMYDAETQYFANRGYSVLKVNFRGSTGFGKKFSDSGRGQWGKIIERDISTVVSQVRKKYRFKNTCAMGGSYGGYSSMMLGIAHPDIYDCVVATFGVFDLPLLFNTSNRKMNEYSLKAVESVVGKLDDSLKLTSPFRLSGKIKFPVLIIAGRNDQVAGFEQSNRMKYILEKQGADVEFEAYNEVGHGHGTWYGERHQHALVDDFIRRKLNISDAASGISKGILAKEKLLIANEYNGTRFTAENPELALKYYRESANLGNAKAKFMLGDFYEHGRGGVKKSISTAVSYYRDASSQGYDVATYHLAELYKGQLVGGVRNDEIFDLYSLADQQGNNLAYLDLARMYCEGSGVEKQFARGLEMFSLQGAGKDAGEGREKFSQDEEEKNITRKERDVIGELLASNLLSHVEIEKIKKYISEKYSIGSFDFSVKIDGFGIVRNDKYYSNSLYVSESKDKISLDEVGDFGVQVKFRGVDEDGGKIAYRIKWTKPRLNDENDKLRSDVNRLFFVSPDNEPVYYFSLDEDWEKVRGDWKIEVYSLDGELLAQKSFTTL